MQRKLSSSQDFDKLNFKGVGDGKIVTRQDKRSLGDILLIGKEGAPNTTVIDKAYRLEVKMVRLLITRLLSGSSLVIDTILSEFESYIRRPRSVQNRWEVGAADIFSPMVTLSSMAAALQQWTEI